MGRWSVNPQPRRLREPDSSLMPSNHPMAPRVDICMLDTLLEQNLRTSLVMSCHVPILWHYSYPFYPS